MTDHHEFRTPKWAREIERFLGIKSQFILWGNINDVYPILSADGPIVGDLCTYIVEILRGCGYQFVLKYEPHTLSLAMGDTQLAAAAISRDITQPLSPVTLKELTSITESISLSKEAGALIINHGSRLSSLCPQEIEQFHYDFFRLSIQASPRQRRFNLVFWIMEKDNDLPPWYTLDNPRVRVLPIPKPDHDLRRQVVKSVSSIIPGYQDLDAEPTQKCRMENIFVDQTGGLFSSEIASIARMAANDAIDFGRVTEAVRQYKLGIPDNPWAKLDYESIRNARSFLSSRVIGQEQAIDHSLDIIKRSIYDLSGAQFASSVQRPKGVMFFAGPTGVGKTELAKSITELIFGSSANYLRFDMSEFNQPHSDQRLVGAPPGYVGYGVGGELTNAVKQNPFSLILFDEIEKAHPKIMDIFLQILDDGRLSSGQGETVYFSDSIIVFTSNLGVYGRNSDGESTRHVSPDMPYDDVKEKINAAIEDYFRFGLNRPEILGRLGRNIVVFDFIRPLEAEMIFDKMLRNILAKLYDSYKITLTLDDEYKRHLAGLTVQDLSLGGRGIGNALEEYFINPLARVLFEIGAQNGGRYQCHLSRGEDGCRLHLIDLKQH